MSGLQGNLWPSCLFSDKQRRASLIVFWDSGLTNVRCNLNLPAGIVSDIKACLSFLSRPKPKLANMKIPSTRGHGHLPVSAGCHCIWFEMHDCNSRCRRWVIPKASQVICRGVYRSCACLWNIPSTSGPTRQGLFEGHYKSSALILSAGTGLVIKLPVVDFQEVQWTESCEKYFSELQSFLALFFICWDSNCGRRVGQICQYLYIAKQTWLTGSLTHRIRPSSYSLRVNSSRKKRRVHTVSGCFGYRGSGWACWHRCGTVDVIITATF